MFCLFWSFFCTLFKFPILTISRFVLTFPVHFPFSHFVSPFSLYFPFFLSVSVSLFPLRLSPPFPSPFQSPFFFPISFPFPSPPQSAPFFLLLSVSICCYASLFKIITDGPITMNQCHSFRSCNPEIHWCHSHWRKFKAYRLWIIRRRYGCTKWNELQSSLLLESWWCCVITSWACLPFKELSTQTCFTRHLCQRAFMSHGVKPKTKFNECCVPSMSLRTYYLTRSPSTGTPDHTHNIGKSPGNEVGGHALFRPLTNKGVWPVLPRCSI